MKKIHNIPFANFFFIHSNWLLGAERVRGNRLEEEAIISIYEQPPQKALSIHSVQVSFTFPFTVSSAIFVLLIFSVIRIVSCFYYFPDAQDSAIDR